MRTSPFSSSPAEDGERPAPRTVDRRTWLAGSVGGLGLSLLTGCGKQAVPAVDTGTDLPYPGKVLGLRVINDRPPCLETPWSYFQHDLTPNEAFYVRWHLQFLPTTVDLATWRLRVGGHVDRPAEWSLDDLKRMTATSVVAVNQCSGNSRGLFDPAVQGAQWGNGAMGNARWTGVPLRALLTRAGLKPGAADVTFAGLDSGGFSTVPDFVKALSVEDATHPDVLVAYEMNGRPLPMLNGFPVRLVVPGWYATYWVKALREITVMPGRFDGFWMAKAYRIPATAYAAEEPAHLATKTVPISRMNVRSFFVRPSPGARVPANDVVSLAGIAFDGGRGIRQVEVSADNGVTWREATLGPDLGKYSFRRWTLSWRPERVGRHRLLVRAVNNGWEGQRPEPVWNRSGYMRNVVEELSLDVG